MKQAFLRLDGENPIVVEMLVVFSAAEVEDLFRWEIPLPEHRTIIHCFYPAKPTKRMLEKLTDTAIAYMRLEV